MINRLFSTMYLNVCAHIQDSSTNMQVEAKKYINDTYFDVLRRTNFEATDPDYTFPTVAGQADYILPRTFGKELYVRDNTNNVPIDPTTLQQLSQDQSATLNSQGQVQKYTIISKRVANQPTSASTLSIVSSSANDTSQKVFVKGYDTSGIFQSEEVTLTGLTPVVTANSYARVEGIAKSATTTGTITCQSNSGAITVAVLSPADLSYLVKAMRLWQIPSSVITVAAPHIIKPMPMTDDYDQPIIDGADIIELGAVAKAWRYKRQFMKAEEIKKEYEQGIISLIWDLANQTNIPAHINPKPYPRDF